MGMESWLWDTAMHVEASEELDDSSLGGAARQTLDMSGFTREQERTEGSKFR